MAFVDRPLQGQQCSVLGFYPCSVPLPPSRGDSRRGGISHREAWPCGLPPAAPPARPCHRHRAQRRGCMWVQSRGEVGSRDDPQLLPRSRLRDSTSVSSLTVPNTLSEPTTYWQHGTRRDTSQSYNVPHTTREKPVPSVTVSEPAEHRARVSLVNGGASQICLLCNGGSRARGRPRSRSTRS